MNTIGARVGAFTIESLASNGIAILSAQIAFESRPDIWASPFTAGNDFTSAIPRLEEFIEQLRVRRFRATFEDAPLEPVKVIARSDDRLAERILWLTGRAVLAIEEVDRLYEAKMEPAPAVPATVDGEPIPPYPCLRRTEMLAKLGITQDPLYHRAPDGPGPRTGYNAA
jgi:hypothetical protein